MKGARFRVWYRIQGLGFGFGIFGPFRAWILRLRVKAVFLGGLGIWGSWIYWDRGLRVEQRFRQIPACGGREKGGGIQVRSRGC